MGPEPEYLHYAFFYQDLIDQAMLQIDPSGAGTTKISYQFFVGRRILIGIVPEDVQ